MGKTYTHQTHKCNSVTSFAADNVFSDGTTYQLATVTGNVADGYIAELAVGLKI